MVEGASPIGESSSLQGVARWWSGAGLVALLATVGWSTGFMRDPSAPGWQLLVVALAVGVVGVWLLYYLANDLVSKFPRSMASALRPYVFVGPALLVLFAYLIFPTIQTIYYSFLDGRSTRFVGLQNYTFVFTDRTMQIAFRNNILWLVLVTGISVGMGLVIAVLVDRIKWEPIAKSLIFLPMAISFVGASVIWRFVYAFQPAGRPQIGLLNAIWTGLGGQPIGWLQTQPLNTFALILIMIWLQTGFCMVILSAAVKAVPSELMEAARIDGATEIQIFLQVIIPYVRKTVVTVATTVIILVLKVFDIVYVMTSGQFGTEVIANRMYAEMFRFRNFGRGSALAVILLLAVIPVMLGNIRSWREERAK